MEQTKETHDQYYEMAHAPVGRVISKLAVPSTTWRILFL